MTGLRRLLVCVALLATGGCSGSDSSDTANVESDEASTVESTEKQILRRQLEDHKTIRRYDSGISKSFWVSPDDVVIQFVLSVPEEVDEGKALPLIVALHQSSNAATGFVGGDILQMLVQPGLKDFPAIIVAPDMIGRSWDNERCVNTVMALANQVRDTYNIDSERILITGYSMGGEGVWEYARRFPDFFSAAISVSGKPPFDAGDTEWKIPILCINSRTDEVYPYRATADAVTELASLNQPVTLSTIEQASHYQIQLFTKALIENQSWLREVWK